MKRLAMLLPLLLLPLDALAGRCPAVPAQIEQAIQQHITKLRAAEYCEARKVKTENGVTVVIYTAEGACAAQDPSAHPGTCSNNWVRYMVALSGTRGTLPGYMAALSGQRVTPPIVVGGKGGLSDKGVKIANGVVTVSGVSVGPSDSLCCPSMPETKRFRLSPSGLSEIPPRRRAPALR